MPLTCPPSCQNQKTICYWDAENAPIPYEMDRDDLLKLFRSSLIRFGYNGVFQIKVFVGGFKENHQTSRMSLQDKETMERHGIPLFYAQSEKKDAADFELLRVLKEDDKVSKYKNNVLIIGGDHRHVKHLKFCQDRHKRNVMLIYTQALKKSVGNVLNKQISLRDYFELPPPSKEDKKQFDIAKRIATGQMNPYHDGQRAKKWRKEQRRKAARNQQQNLELDEAEAAELQILEMGIHAEVSLGIDQEPKVVCKKGTKKNKKRIDEDVVLNKRRAKLGKGFSKEKKQKQKMKEEEEEEEEMKRKRKGSFQGKRGRGVVREEKKQKQKKKRKKKST